MASRPRTRAGPRDRQGGFLTGNSRAASPGTCCPLPLETFAPISIGSLFCGGFRSHRPHPVPWQPSRLLNVHWDAATRRDGPSVLIATDLSTCSDGFGTLLWQGRLGPGQAHAQPPQTQAPTCRGHRPLTSGQSSPCEGVPGRQGVSWGDSRQGQGPAGTAANGLPQKQAPRSQLWVSVVLGTRSSPRACGFHARLNRSPGHPQLRGGTPGKGRGITGWTPSWRETHRQGQWCRPLSSP